MTPAEALMSLLKIGAVPVPEGENLRVLTSTPIPPEVKAAVREHKAAIIGLINEMPMPYLDEQGELHVPLGTQPQYRWWAGGMPVGEILEMLGAPQSVRDRYVERNRAKESP